MVKNSFSVETKEAVMQTEEARIALLTAGKIQLRKTMALIGGTKPNIQQNRYISDMVT